MINTVVLFLRDTLPIFLLLSLLFSLNVSVKQLSIRVSFAAIVSALCYINISSLASAMNGTGFELLKILCSVFSWIGFCLYLWAAESTAAASTAAAPTTKASAVGLWLMITGVCVPATLHFLIYFISSWALHANDNGLLMGSIIGLGITCCVAILLNIILTTLLPVLVTRIVITLFFAGQIASITTLLEQINVLFVPIYHWDTSNFISDSSEYGHLLNALLGYEATPSLSYLLIYAIALLVPLALLWIKKRRLSRRAASEAQC